MRWDEIFPRWSAVLNDYLQLSVDAWWSSTFSSSTVIIFSFLHLILINRESFDLSTLRFHPSIKSLLDDHHHHLFNKGSNNTDNGDYWPILLLLTQAISLLKEVGDWLSGQRSSTETNWNTYRLILHTWWWVRSSCTIIRLNLIVLPHSHQSLSDEEENNDSCNLKILDHHILDMFL